MTKWIAIAALALVGACASSVPYGPATSDGAKGYTVLPIENNRFRITYKDNSEELARTRALRRAAEVTRERGDDWFQIVTAYTDTGELAGGGGSSVSIGGSSGSSGRSSVGVGVGIALPLGGGSSGPVEHVIEIVTAPGAKPDNPDAYAAEDVLMNLGGF
ncbi:MAG: CC0125/CC1285 family lipoprotein [Henriciella sp.]